MPNATLPNASETVAHYLAGNGPIRSTSSMSPSYNDQAMLALARATPPRSEMQRPWARGAPNDAGVYLPAQQLGHGA